MEISEPMPAPIAKAHGQFRFQCIIKSTSSRLVADTSSKEIANLHHSEGITGSLDFAPYSFL